MTSKDEPKTVDGDYPLTYSVWIDFSLRGDVSVVPNLSGTHYSVQEFRGPSDVKDVSL